MPTMITERPETRAEITVIPEDREVTLSDLARPVLPDMVYTLAELNFPKLDWLRRGGYGMMPETAGSSELLAAEDSEVLDARARDTFESDLASRYQSRINELLATAAQAARPLTDGEYGDHARLVFARRLALRGFSADEVAQRTADTERATERALAGLAKSLSAHGSACLPSVSKS
jgi:hypothetical protein